MGRILRKHGHFPDARCVLLLARRYASFKSVVIGLVMTFFSAFDVPVFWPILLLYWFILFFVTMKRQIKHMIKYRYVPFSWGKKVGMGISGGLCCACSTHAQQGMHALWLPGERVLLVPPAYLAVARLPASCIQQLVQVCWIVRPTRPTGWNAPGMIVACQHMHAQNLDHALCLLQKYTGKPGERPPPKDDK